MNNRVVLVGFAGSGKNTVGERLIERGYTPFSFADALKDTLASIFCWDRQAIEGVTPETRAWREQVDPWWAERLGVPHFTPRFALQNIGTDLFRQYFNREIWILNVEKRILDLGDKPVVVTDGRFRNEVSLITDKLKGMAVRVKRGDDPYWWNVALMANLYGSEGAQKKMADIGVHPSEWDWIGSHLNVVIENDGTMEELKAKADALIS